MELFSIGRRAEFFLLEEVLEKREFKELRKVIFEFGKSFSVISLVLFLVALSAKICIIFL